MSGGGGVEAKAAVVDHAYLAERVIKRPGHRFGQWLLHKPGGVRVGGDDVGMSQNFPSCDRDQELLLPPSLREWLPAGHFAWFVLDAVEEKDLSGFYAAYRHDGHGRAAHDPGMMVALL